MTSIGAEKQIEYAVGIGVNTNQEDGGEVLTVGDIADADAETDLVVGQAGRSVVVECRIEERVIG